MLCFLFVLKKIFKPTITILCKPHLYSGKSCASNLIKLLMSEGLANVSKETAVQTAFLLCLMQTGKHIKPVAYLFSYVLLLLWV